jgi:hypothetical protein
MLIMMMFLTVNERAKIVEQIWMAKQVLTTAAFMSERKQEIVMKRHG